MRKFWMKSTIVQDFAHFFKGTVEIDLPFDSVGIEFLHHSSEYQILFHQLPVNSLQFIYSILHRRKLFNSISFAFLREFGTFPISPDTIALFAVAAFIPIVRAFFQQFLHFQCIEISTINFLLILDIGFQEWITQHESLNPHEIQIQKQNMDNLRTLHLHCL